MCAPPVKRSRIRITVVSAVTISSTNMTGFLISVRGLSLAKDETIAGITILGSSSADTGIVLRWVEVSIGATPDLIGREKRAGIHRELLDDWAERECREEGEATDNHDHANDKADEQAAGGGEGADRCRDQFLLGKRAGDDHGWDDHPEAADAHRDCASEIVEQCVSAQAREGRAVIAGLRNVSVEDLRKAVRTRIVRRGDRGWHQHRDR